MTIRILVMEVYSPVDGGRTMTTRVIACERDPDSARPRGQHPSHCCAGAAASEGAVVQRRRFWSARDEAIGGQAHETSRGAPSMTADHGCERSRGKCAPVTLEAFHRAFKHLNIVIGLLVSLLIASLARTATHGLSVAVAVSEALTVLLLLASVKLWRYGHRLERKGGRSTCPPSRLGNSARAPGP